MRYLRVGLHIHIQLQGIRQTQTSVDVW